MYDTRSYYAVDTAQTVKVVQKCVDERVVFLIRTRLMHHHTLRFVDDRHIFVLIDDIERNILRLDFQSFGCGHFKIDDIADFEFKTALVFQLSVDCRAVFFYDVFCVGTRNPPIFRNKYVKSLAVFDGSFHYSFLLSSTLWLLSATLASFEETASFASFSMVFDAFCAAFSPL